MTWFRERLNKLLERSNKTHWQLARDLHLADETVRVWLRGPFLPDRQNIKRLAKYFDVHPAHLEYGIDSDIIKIISEFQEYEPETVEKLKQILSLIYQINEEKRKKIRQAKEKKPEELLQELSQELQELFNKNHT